MSHNHAPTVPGFRPLLPPLSRSRQQSTASIPVSVWITIFFMVLLRLTLAWIPLQDSFALTVPDDGYYYFTIAHHLASGQGMTIDGVIPTNGFHPLWLVLITPFWLIAGKQELQLPVHLALSLGALLDGLTMVGLFCLCRQIMPKRLWLGQLVVLVYALNPYNVAASVNGLETSLALSLFVAFLLLYGRLRAESRPRRSAWFLLGIVGSLLLLARTDYLIILFPCALDLLWRHRHQRRDLEWARLGAFLWLPWLAWNWVTFGSVAQVSGKAYPYYMHTIWTSVDRSWGDWLIQEGRMAFGIVANLAHFSGLGKGIILLAVAVMGLGVWAYYRRRHGQPLPQTREQQLIGLLWPTVGALALLFTHGLVRWMYVPWYFVPSSLLAVLWLGLVLNWVASKRWWLAAAVILIFLVAQAIEGIHLWQQEGMWAEQKTFALAWMAEGERLCAQYDVLGVSDSGYFGYFLPCRVVNLDGVVNNQAFAAIREKRFRHYLDETCIDYILINDIVRETVTLNEGPIPDCPPFAPVMSEGVK